MIKKSPVEIFSDWVDLGKDEGMEINHKEAVDEMLKAVTYSKNSFSFIDAGCGNGWVVRKVSKLKNCESSSGVDGSLKMINKARRLDNINEYICAELSTWKPKNKKDIVHTMEVLYYFKKPLIVLENIFENWINENGKFIMGIDFYYENKSSHDWPEKTNVDTMTLLNIKQWEKLVINAGFKNVRSWTVGKKNNWNGTLIISATKS
ncbi:MAG: class I SAM-dependent methyltransferase [Flavobacteriaceae bacterium]